MRWRLTLVCAAMAVVAVVAALASVAFGAFPGTDPDESVRSNTPNDTDYDPCESDHSGDSHPHGFLVPRW